MKHYTKKENFLMLIVMFLVSLLLFPGVVFGSVFRAAVPSDIGILDPAIHTHTQERVILQQVLEGLVEFDYTVSPPYPVVPLLAKDFQVAEDSMAILFNLRQGVQFHHGFGELTASDIVFSMSRHLNPEVGSLVMAQYEHVENIEALDDYTVKVTLNQPTAFTFLQNISFQGAGFIFSQKAAKELGNKILRYPVGTGPFYFHQWNPQEKVILKKFPDYWGKPAQIEQVEFWIIPEEIVALGSVESGNIDLTPLRMRGSFSEALSLAEKEGFKMISSDGGASIYMVYLNHGKEPMNDLRVRRALAHALDIDSLVERIGPQVVKFPSPLAPVVFGATDDYWNYEYNLEKAKELLEESGYPNGFDLTIIYNRSSLYEPVAMEVANSWKDIVNVNLVLVDRAIWSSRLQEFNHHVAVWGLARNTPFLLAQAYISKSPRNFSNYANPIVDEVILKAQTALTEEESLYYWREFQRLATEEVINLWSCVETSVAITKENIEGIIIMGFPGLYILREAIIN